MTKSLLKWSIIGSSRNLIVLAFAILLMKPSEVHSKEFWNLVGKSPDVSAIASAEALEAVILGFSAFRRAETEGVDARKNDLQMASEKLLSANKIMIEASAKFANDPASSTRLSFAAVPADAQTELQQWLTAGKVDAPKTWGELYKVGTNATGDLASTYAELAKRDDGAVFRDFLNATYPYLKAGATASEIFAQ